MTSKKTFDIINAFNNYKALIFKVDNDLRFWKSFLNLSIKNYQNQDSKPEEIYSAIFSVYDIDSNSNKGYLKCHKEVLSIKTVNLEDHRKMFFSWILNLSILKGYTALETFLLQAIWLKYFPALSNPTSKKQNADKIQKEIKNYLTSSDLNYDTKNNRHLIEFLRNKSQEFSVFIQKSIRVDLNTTWEDYFELISILRNIIAHQGTIVSNDTHNKIKTKAKDIFERHFSIVMDLSNDKHLTPKEEDFNNFMSLMNDFSVNTVKFIWNEKDFKFLNLR